MTIPSPAPEFRTIPDGEGDPNVDAISQDEPSQSDSLAALLVPALDEMEAIQGGGPSPGIPTGLEDLDEITNGLAPGSLTVIGAHPGVGASTLALGFARSAAIGHDIPAAILSLDDTIQAITQRLLSAEARVRIEDMRAGRLTEEDWTRLALRTTDIHEKPLTISRAEDPDITSVADTVASLVEHKNARLVIIDSLHMLTCRRDMPYENREREVAEVTRRLKRLALDTNAAIVATAQLSTNPGPRMPVPALPSLADLRDSGTIAHVANNVLLIHRPDAWDRNDIRAGEVDLILAKHRHGPTATVLIAHQLHYSRFASFATT